MMESNYQPTGWLGMLLGTRLYYSFFGGPALPDDSYLTCLRRYLDSQIGPESVIAPAVEHALSVYPDGSVCYEGSVCRRVWCVHVNVMAAKAVSSSGNFSQVRLSDFLSDLYLTAERADYMLKLSVGGPRRRDQSTRFTMLAC